MLDMRKVTALVDDERWQDNGGDINDRDTPTVASADAAEERSTRTYRRRYSDLDAMMRAARAASTVAMDWTHSTRIQRKSLDSLEMRDQVTALRSRYELVVHRKREHARRAVAVSTADDALADKRYAEMMARFQIRLVPKSSSSSAHSSRSNSAHDPSERDHATARGSVSGSSRVHPDASDHRSRADELAPHRRHVTQASTGDNESTDELADHDDMPVASRWSWLQERAHILFTPMSPISSTARVRQLGMLVVVVVHTVYSPMEVAFFPHHDNLVWVTIDIALEVALILDCALTFNTSYLDRHGQLVESRAAIARRYVRGWFLLDLLSSIPVEIVLAVTHHTELGESWYHILLDGLVRVPRYAHLVQSARLAWVRKLHETDRSTLTWLFYSRYSHLVRIATVIVLVVVLAHYMACILHLLRPKPALAVPPMTAYLDHFYDALQLLQGQGIETSSVAENAFAAAAVLIGSIALAVVFGHVAILVSNFNANATGYQRKMESVFAVMRKLQLPAPLRERVHQYYEHLWREYESLDGEIVAFSKGLSHTLELEVVLFKYMDLIMHVPLWRDCSPDFQKQLMLHLHVRVYLPDDFIMRRGEVGDEFYMINRGVCELALGSDSVEGATEPIVNPAGEQQDGDASSITSARHGVRPRIDERLDRVRPMEKSFIDKHKRGQGTVSVKGKGETQTLRRGQAFGELALVMNYERTANARAQSHVEMCVLRRAAFQSILLKHPADRRRVLACMVGRALAHNEARGVHCPIRSAVQSVLDFGGLDDHNGGTNEVSTAHATLLVTNAINAEVEDASIKFGIGASLRRQLVELRDRQAKSAAEAAASQETPTPLVSPDLVTDDVRVNQQVHTRLGAIASQQRSLLEAMAELQQELRVTRDEHNALLHTLKSTHAF